MNAYQVTLPNFNQIDQVDQDAIIGQMVTLFAGPLENARLLTLVMPTRYDKLEKERRQLAMSRPYEWERRGLMEEVRIISNLGDRGEVRKARHYFIDFGNIIGPGELAHWRINSTPAFPELPDGEYVEFTDHLAPIMRPEKGKWQIDESRYKCTVLASYQLNRSWDWRYPFVQTISEATGPMVVCLDIRKVHPEKVAGAVEFWTGMVLNGHDRKAAIAQQEAEAALRLRNEAVHQMRVLFMLLDKDLVQLRKRADSLRKVLTQYMRIDRLLGYQKAAAAMFTPDPHPVGVPDGHYNVTSSAAAVSAGMWGASREQYSSGVYMGISLDEVAPHVYYLDWKGNDPFHGMILGKTGKGKTVAAQAMAWRMAEQGVQVVLLEPNGHSKKLLKLAGANASYSRISYEETRLNILDVVYENPSDQYDHVITLLALLLDPMGNTPRQFNTLEIAAIRKALQMTYANLDWRQELLTNHTLTPTLGIFCRKLRQIVQQAGGTGFVVPHQAEVAGSYSIHTAAMHLADEIEGLYVYGDYAAVFNTSSNTDLTLKERVVLFDFSRVPESRRALFYYAILAGVNLQIRQHPRKRAIIVDEVAHMAKEASLMRFLADLVKTVRTFGAAILMIDQDLEAFIGVEGRTASHERVDVTSGQFIINNVSWTIAFGLKRDAAYRLMGHYQDEILPSHAEFITAAGSDDVYGKGKAIIRANGKADIVYFKLRPMEEETLFGS